MFPQIMKLFRPASAEKDRLFIVTKKHHAMILEVEGEGASFDIVTRAYGDVRDKIGKKSETGTLAVIDPESRVIGLRLYDSLFKVVISSFKSQSVEEQQTNRYSR